MPTRRQFIVGAGAGLVCAGTVGGILVFRRKFSEIRRGYALAGKPDVPPRAPPRFPSAQGKSRVVEVVHPSILASGPKPEAREVQAMLDRALRTAFDTENASDAWKALFPDREEVVGIKVNAVAGRAGPNTSPELVRAIVHGLGVAGIPPEHILVFDRSHEELTEAGFTVNPDGPGVRIIATNSLFRFTQFGRTLYTVAGQPVRLTQMVRLCSALINCSVVKHHGQAGYTGALKNWYGVIDRPARFHEAIHRAAFIPEVANLPPLRMRLRLSIVEAIRSQCERGPHGAREWQFAPKAIFVGADEVALDTIGALLVEEERRKRGLPSLAETGRKPEYLTVAAHLGLGTNDLNRIERITEEL